MCPCKWWTSEHLLWTNSCKQFAFFMCFWFKWLLSIVSYFYCVDTWWSIGLLQSFKLAKDSERTKSKMLLFCTVLIFALVFMTFDRYLLDRWWKVTLETFYMHAKCKFLIFKFSEVMQQHTWGSWGVFGNLICWKFSALCSGERILQIDQELA